MDYCGPRGIALDTFLEWPQDSQDAALSWQAYEGRRCQRCGTHPDEPRLHTHIDVCPGCVALDQTSKSEEAKQSGAHVKMARGERIECERCRTEARANGEMWPDAVDRKG